MDSPDTQRRVTALDFALQSRARSLEDSLSDLLKRANLIDVFLATGEYDEQRAENFPSQGQTETGMPKSTHRVCVERAGAS